MVKDPKLVPMFEELEHAVASCSEDARRQVHKRLHVVLARFEAQGCHVPQRMHELDDMLAASRIEDTFDNIPV
ncbi:hypothetical protein M8756_02390 [Lutimaribacter sp. EGI FJ00015]|uniref:Uncharacterized protein n=1 Tax=Lutimaribacter degradans TaxID=2945989 RepID=A0ACC5ZRL1_9RHOB|nr:hypothetical protein [Lutimaribacter sp. EGI FJ00013]MCM2560912.1 hypothetical protein [Lutimaribacter sp. EGI FJ00013]MCO0612143.1 hypothetical protein [Lutimaribacter sp. EGI FJ00015]MCO0634737.1 hypothetical protein [Lutimaribacter sp. EGI FJ00014]